MFNNIKDNKKRRKNQERTVNRVKILINLYPCCNTSESRLPNKKKWIDTCNHLNDMTYEHSIHNRNQNISG